MQDVQKNALIMWIKSSLLAVIIFVLAISYVALFRGSIDWIVASESLAFTGGILIGISFALSGLTFFYNFLDSKLKYRKHIGLLGYYFAVAYTLTLIIRFPERYWFGLSSHVFDAEVLLGLGAMAILTFMAVISQNWAAKRLGSHWRPLLRLGYIAYALLIIRAVIVESAGWQIWAEEFDRVPPPRLLLTMYALLVIMLRLVLEIALQTKKKPVVSTLATNSNITTSGTTPQLPTPPVNNSVLIKKMGDNTKENDKHIFRK